jgi:hypothetical protein
LINKYLQRDHLINGHCDAKTNGLWHFSGVACVDEGIKKFEIFAHHELGKPKFKNLEKNKE